MSNEQVAMSNERKQSKLDELIQQYCPDGVPNKTLGELGKFFGGLTGKSKDDLPMAMQSLLPIRMFTLILHYRLM